MAASLQRRERDSPAVDQSPLGGGTMKQEFLQIVEDACFEALTSRERSFFFRLYGFGGYAQSSLTDIGKTCKISRERVRQLTTKAASKIIRRGRQRTDIDSVTSCQRLRKYLLDHCSEERATTKMVQEFFDSGLFVFEDNAAHIRLALILLGVGPKDAIRGISESKCVLEQAEKDQRSQERADHKFSELLKAVEWPHEVENAREKYGKQIDQKRDTNTNENGLYEYIYSEKAGRAIYYDSKLEASFYELLERTPMVEYFAEQPFLIPYGEGVKLDYCPDVYVLLKDGRGIIFEVKPGFHMPLWKNLIKYNALRSFCANEGLGCSMTDMRVSFSNLERTKVHPEFMDAVLSTLKGGSIGWTQYAKIKEVFKPTKEEFIALVIQNNLRWRQEPFRLSTGK